MVAKCNSKAWHSGPRPTEVDEARRPGGLRLSPTVFSPHGIDLSYGTEYSASIVLSAAGKHRRGTKETKAEYRHGAFGRPGVASRHSSQSGCRIRPCEDAPLRAAAAAAAAKPFTASLQACLPVLSSVLCPDCRVGELRPNCPAQLRQGGSRNEGSDKRRCKNPKMAQAGSGRASVGVGSWCCIAKCAPGFVLRFSLAKLPVDVVLWR